MIVDNSRYMFLQSRNLKVKIVAKNGSWKFTIKGKKWIMPEWLERLLIHLYIGENNIRENVKTLLLNYNNITATEIIDLLLRFSNRHESSDAIFDLKNLPLCSTYKTPMIIPNAYNYDVY